MTTEEQHHQDTHQQSSGGDDDTVILPCLHCRLMETYSKWVDDYTAAVGEPPSIMHMADRVGAFVGEMTAMASHACGHDLAVMTEFGRTFVQSQSSRVPVIVVDEDEPAADTKH